MMGRMGFGRAPALELPFASAWDASSEHFVDGAARHAVHVQAVIGLERGWREVRRPMKPSTGPGS
jgi:hypothetical protein